MKKTIWISTLLAVILLTGIFNFRAKAATSYPTSETQTLITSLAPLNATLGSNITWLIWTDPNASGHVVHLNIVDVSNATTILNVNETLGTLNECGSLQKQVSTAGFEHHQYRFTAGMDIGNMEIMSSKNLDFRLTQFSIYAYASPYEAIPGENLSLDIFEGNYPYVDATANATVYNGTNPDLWTLNDIALPSTNGSRTVQIPTTGLSPGLYAVTVTAMSVIGNDNTTAYFGLLDLIVTTDYLYYIGQMVNVTVRTYSTVSQASLQIFSAYPFPAVFPLNDTLTLTDGRASELYNSSTWPPRFYTVACNATVGLMPIVGYGSFTLDAFAVDVASDKSNYAAGQVVNITVSTTPQQPNAWYNLTVRNSTGSLFGTFGPSQLNGNGETSLTFNTTGLIPDFYDVEAFVNNTKYVVSGTDGFEIVMSTFNIFASVEPYSNTGYAMPILNVTVTPAQTRANMTIQFSSPAPNYFFFKHDINFSTYLYLLPAIDIGNGTHYVGVSVASNTGTNATYTYFTYSNGKDSDGDGLSDLAEQNLGTSPNSADSDGDGFFDGMEVFHGSNPLSPANVVPEYLVIPYVAALSMISTLAMLARFLKRKPTR